MEENTVSQHKRQYDWLKQYQWQKGQSGNPKGGPKGKSAKTRAREWIEKMTDEQLAEFLNQVNPDMVWRMAEGNPQEDITSGGKTLPAPILNINEICKDERNQKDNAPEQENKVCPGGDSGKQDNINNNLSDSPSAD